MTDVQSLTKQAQRRLDAIQQMEELGSGFYLAMHDLEIRGAGEVLGDSQSGEMTEIGFQLYSDMLNEAVRSLKAGKEPDLAAPLATTTEINLHVPALLPAGFCGDVHERLSIYKRMANCNVQDKIDDMQEEMIDRFGPLPEATDNLVKIMEIKLNAKKACVAKLDVGPKGALVAFHDDTPPNIAGLLAYVDKLGGIAKLRPDSKLALTRVWADQKARLHGALQLSKGLAKAAG